MTDDYRLIAAVGSSFAAGPGIDPIVDKAALRSGANYAHLLAQLLDARLVDLSVSGATTATVLDKPQRMLFKRFAPQLSGVPRDADLVTITVGGNDFRFAASMLAAAIGSRLKRGALTRPLGTLLGRKEPLEASDEDVARAAAGLASIATAVKSRAPRARVILVDYLTILGSQTRPSDDVPFTDAEIALFTSVQSALQTAFITASQDSGTELVQASRLSLDHGLGSAEPWVFGFRGRRHIGSAFHPNSHGMLAIAEELYSRIGNN